MDADHRLNGSEADRKLRALFQHAGPLTAPAGLEERVLRSIAPAPAAPAAEPEPLLPRWAWPAIGIVLVALCLSALIGHPGNGGTGLWERLLPEVKAPSLHHVLSLSWVRMGTLAAIFFATLEMVLGRRRPARATVP